MDSMVVLCDAGRAGGVQAEVIAQQRLPGPAAGRAGDVIENSAEWSEQE